MEGGGPINRRGQQSLVRGVRQPWVAPVVQVCSSKYCNVEKAVEIGAHRKDSDKLQANDNCRFLTFRASIIRTISDTSDGRIWIACSMEKEKGFLRRCLRQQPPPGSGSHSHMQERLGAGET